MNVIFAKTYRKRYLFVPSLVRIPSPCLGKHYQKKVRHEKTSWGAAAPRAWTSRYAGFVLCLWCHRGDSPAGNPLLFALKGRRGPLAQSGNFVNSFIMWVGLGLDRSHAVSVWWGSGEGPSRHSGGNPRTCLGSTGSGWCPESRTPFSRADQTNTGKTPARPRPPRTQTSRLARIGPVSKGCCLQLSR